jgi:hypothetical protein
MFQLVNINSYDSRSLNGALTRGSEARWSWAEIRFLKVN